MSTKDELGMRIKTQYEDRARYYLSRRSYHCIRIDGRAFHTYTKGFKKPFDSDLTNWMERTASYVAQQVQGAKLAYVQSDEISILLTDFDKPETQLFFDGNIQKISSVVASIATVEFNKSIFETCKTIPSWATFDCRVFTISDPIEVYNYFHWRQKDCMRNAISSIAQANFSHRELQGISTENLIKKLVEKGVDLSQYENNRLGALFSSYGNWKKQYLQFLRNPEFIKLIPLQSGKDLTELLNEETRQKIDII